jgi:GNAT superfamily N-acetyltransferase
VDDIEIIPVELKGLQRFADMYQVCLRQCVDARYFQWKYLENPAGRAVAFEARHAGKPVAFYGVIPEAYRVAGKPFIVYQSMDTMTHPDFQGKGLFVRLATATYDEILKSGHEVAIGIPGMNSLPGFVRRLQWSNIHSFRYAFTHRLTYGFGGRSARGLKRTFMPIDDIEDIRDYWLHRDHPTAAVTNEVTPEFLEWRVFRRPHERFKVAAIKDGHGATIGVCVYSTPERNRCFLHWIEFVNDGEYAASTRLVIQSLMHTTKADWIFTWQPLRAALRNELQGRFRSNPFKSGPFSYRVPLIVRAHRPVHGIDMLDIANYDVQPLMQD